MGKLQLNTIGLTQSNALGQSNALDVNMDSMLCNLNSAFNPLHRDCLMNYQVQAVSSSQVCMSVVMPNEMLNSFSTLLESMSGFFRIVNNKARSSSAVRKVYDVNMVAEREQFIAERKQKIGSTYDSFIKKGHSTAESIKLTNIALKAQNEEWVSRYIVESVLRSMGRFRKNPKKEGGRGGVLTTPSL